jgi:YVTN family beta-propeller protein
MAAVPKYAWGQPLPESGMWAAILNLSLQCFRDEQMKSNSFMSRLMVACLALGITSIGLAASTVVTPGVQPDGRAVVSTEQIVSPVGKVQRIEGSRPKDMALSPDGQFIAVQAQEAILIFSPDGTRIASVPFRAGSLGLAWAPDSRSLYVSGVANLGVIVHEGASWRMGSNVSLSGKLLPASLAQLWDWLTRRLGVPDVDAAQPGGLAVSPDGKRLYVALGTKNAVSVIDLASEKIVSIVQVGIAPYSLALSRDGQTLYVANRGGEPPKDGEPAARSAGALVRIDPATDAALQGSLSIVSANTLSDVHRTAHRQAAIRAGVVSGWDHALCGLLGRRHGARGGHGCPEDHPVYQAGPASGSGVRTDADKPGALR